MKPINMTLPDLIKKKRGEKGLSQMDLAIRVGMSLSTIAKLEQGLIQKPSMQTVKDLFQALDVTGDEMEMFMSQKGGGE